jgi:hypothetical protein
MKYMAPPTDTAIPVGELILENSLIKEIGLKISDGVDDFDIPVETLNQTVDIIHREKSEGTLDPNGAPKLSADILRNVDIVDQKLESEQIKQSIDYLLNISDVESIDAYGTVFEYFIENYTKDDDFVAAETRDPTSGKGLAYVVEAVMAYSKNIEVPKRSRDVLSRFVNRTPKLRDSADCAITKAVQSVNWKNYNLEVYDNGLPKGSIKLLVNVSGPFVHLMFKSQSKNALADDENLIKEIKFCLEAIGRRLRIYTNRKANIHKSEKRTSLIEKYIPAFAKSVYNIASQGESRYKAKINIDEIESLMREAIGKKPTPVVVPEVKPKKIDVKKEEFVQEEIHPKIEILSDKTAVQKDKISRKTLLNWTVEELKSYCSENNIQILSKARKNDIIDRILDSFTIKKTEKEPELEQIKKLEEKKPQIQEITTKKPKIKETPVIEKPVTTRVQAKPLKGKPTQTTLPIITTDRILKVLTEEWQTIKHLIFNLKIKDMMDARYLQLKLKELERKGQVLVEVKMGRKHWKLNKGD